MLWWFTYTPRNLTWIPKNDAFLDVYPFKQGYFGYLLLIYVFLQTAIDEHRFQPRLCILKPSPVCFDHLKKYSNILSLHRYVGM